MIDGYSISPKDPKFQQKWNRIRWFLLLLLLCSLFAIVFRWEEWVIGRDQDLDASTLLHDLTWPIFDQREKAFTLRCHNNCSNHAAQSCNPSTETYCTCSKGFVGFDCSVPLCSKCRVPDVLVIGVQKGGTTALTTYLRSNPSFLTSRKDHFFDDNWDRGLIWYFSQWDYQLDVFDPSHLVSLLEQNKEEEEEELTEDEEEILTSITKETEVEIEEEEQKEEILLQDFLTTTSHQSSSSSSSSSSPTQPRIKFGGSPKYIISDVAISRLYALHPTVRFIVLLRNPTTRAYSGVLMNERKGYFTPNLTAEERGLLSLLIKESHLDNSNHVGDSDDQLRPEGEGLSLGGVQFKWRTFSAKDNPRVKALKDALKKKLTESNQETFDSMDSERILLRGVEVVQACLDEARAQLGGPLFRELVSLEMEELIRERGTDIQAFFEWQACFSPTAALVTSLSTLRTMYPEHHNELVNNPNFNEGDGRVIQLKEGFSTNQRILIIRPLGWSSIVRGLYFHQLNQWFTYFNSSQFFFIRSESLLQTTQMLLDGLHDWLGAVPYSYKQEDLQTMSSAPSTQPMTLLTQQTLNEFYAPYNVRLVQLTQREDLSWT